MSWIVQAFLVSDYFKSLSTRVSARLYIFAISDQFLGEFWKISMSW